MTTDPLAFGVLLRRWRERRRLTQTDFALAANSSTRDLSYLETRQVKKEQRSAAGFGD